MASAHGLLGRTQTIVTGSRLLTWDDLPRLSEHRGVGNNSLRRVRQVHHKIARLMAAGAANVEIAAVVGMHQARISILRNDPAFCELLAYYEEHEEARWEDVREKAAELGSTAVEILQERLLEEPDKVKTNDLLSIMNQGLEFGGKKPAARSENLHVHTTAEAIQQIKAGRQENVSVRDGQVGAKDDGAEVLEGEIVTEADGGEEVREEDVGIDAEPAGDAVQESMD